MKFFRIIMNIGTIIVLCMTMTLAQEKKEFRYTVSYVAASVVYIDAGREQNIAVGDTLRIYRNTKQIGSVVVTAISRRSSAAQIISQAVSILASDSATIEKITQPQPSVVEARDTTVQPAISKTPLPPAKQEKVRSAENIVSGRVSLQYAGVLAEDTRFNLSQPSALFRLDVQNLYGTGMVFTMYGRSYYDLSNFYQRYGYNSRSWTRLYEFQLQRDIAGSAWGYGVGRMTSRYVGGLGTFDGGQIYFRQENITTGVLFGSSVQERTVSLNSDDKRGALFINYRYGQDFLHQYDGTIAYARQLFRDKLDREFIYLQNSVSFGPLLSLYESTEIELNDINNGIRSGAFKLSNTFFSLNYYPYPWLTTNLGYDATRSVYLFSAMRSIADTLFDKEILQGFRGSATVRLPYFITISGNAMYRTKRNDPRDAHTLGATVRMSDIAHSEINAGVRYANIVGVYTEGNNFTFDVDRSFFYALSVALRYDYYHYIVTSLHQTYTTHTVTANLNYRISRMWYTAVSIDDIFDATMNSYRIYADIGIRF